jgi:hypothetical protein
MSTRFQRNASIETAPLQNELMLFDAAQKKFCVLNPSAAHVWQQLEQPRTAEELVSALCDQFDTPGHGPVTADIEAVLGEMETLNLVTRTA